MTRQYKAFISYSWADKDWGEWLHRALETYRAPSGVADGKTLHPIFKDREEEAAGGSVGAAIEAALDASEVLIVICSPRSAQSMWVNHEIAWFKTHKDKANILALIVDGEPGAASVAGREAEECFPKTLTHKIGADLQPTDEWEDAPLAADARPSGDGKRGAKLKLAAALLGVGLDALVRRDERRRTIRRRFVTSAAFGLAAVLGGLSIFAFNQRDAAVVAQTGAVKARDDAEGIIELILTDLKSDLEGFGTLKSVTAIGNRAIGYYEGQDVKALTPDQLGRRARVLLMLGEADNKRGDLTAALARYETAAATTSEQLTRDPENPQRMFDHAQSVYWVGYIAWQRGDRAAAKRQFTEYHDLAQRLVAKDPANEDWQAELDYAYSNLGTLAMDDGDAAAAEEYFRKSLELALVRLADAPEDVERVLAAGQSYAWLADAHYRQVELTKAKTARLGEMDLYERLLGTNPTRNDIRNKLLGTAYNLASIALAAGAVDEAAKHSALAVSIADSLMSIEPENADYSNRSVFAYTTAAEVSYHAGDNARALLLISKSALISNRLTSEAAQIDGWRNVSEIQAALIQGRIEAERSSLESAADIFSDIAKKLESRAVSGVADPILVRRYCLALAGMARLSPDKDLWAKINLVMGPTRRIQGPEGLNLFAESKARIGAVADAAPIVGRLYAAGYRHPDFMRLLNEFQNLKAAAERMAH